MNLYLRICVCVRVCLYVCVSGAWIVLVSRKIDGGGVSQALGAYCVEILTKVISPCASDFITERAALTEEDSCLYYETTVPGCIHRSTELSPLHIKQLSIV